MKRYKVLSQHILDERTFDLQDLDDDRRYSVDIFTDGNLQEPEEYTELCRQEKYEEAGVIFGNWLKSFVGKTIECDGISPYAYFSNGVVKVIPNPTIEH